MAISPRVLAIALSLLVGVTACSATGMVNCEGRFEYNPDEFTAEQKTWIHNAASRWNNWTDRPISAVRPGYNDICSINVGSPKDNPNAIGSAHSRTQNILIDVEDMRARNILNQEVFEGVVMHEIGHTLGYDHLDGKNSTGLMSPAGTKDFTERDRIACIKHGMCLTLLSNEQVAQLNEKEKEENETQPSDCDRKGNEGSRGPGAYESPSRPSEAGIAIWHCPRL